MCTRGCWTVAIWFVAPGSIICKWKEGKQEWKQNKQKEEEEEEEFRGPWRRWSRNRPDYFVCLPSGGDCRPSRCCCPTVAKWGVNKPNWNKQTNQTNVKRWRKQSFNLLFLLLLKSSIPTPSLPPCLDFCWLAPIGSGFGFRWLDAAWRGLRTSRPGIFHFPFSILKGFGRMVAIRLFFFVVDLLWYGWRRVSSTMMCYR